MIYSHSPSRNWVDNSAASSRRDALIMSHISRRPEAERLDIELTMNASEDHECHVIHAECIEQLDRMVM